MRSDLVWRSEHTLFGQGLCKSAQTGQAVSTQLVKDWGQHLRQLLGLGVACDGEGVGCQRGLHFGVVEVDHRALVCEHVHLQSNSVTGECTKQCVKKKFVKSVFSWTDAHLLNARDVIYSQFLEGELKFFVIGSGRSVDHLLLSASGALSTQYDCKELLLFDISNTK